MKGYRCKVKINGEQYNAEILLTGQGLMIKKVKWLRLNKSPTLLIPFNAIISLEYRKTLFGSRIKILFHSGIKLFEMILRGNHNLKNLYDSLKIYKEYYNIY